MTMSLLYPCGKPCSRSAIIKSKSTGQQETHRHQSRERRTQEPDGNQNDGKDTIKRETEVNIILVFEELDRLSSRGKVLSKIYDAIVVELKTVNKEPQ